MATDPLANAVEIFAAPIDSLIIALGQGISQAQQALDKNSIQSQQAIDADPVLSQYGLQATWYQFPSVSMELKLSLSIAQDQTSSTPSSAPAGLAINALPLRIVAQPLSASFQTHFTYDAQAASQVNVTIAPVPGPKVAGQISTPPLMLPDQVQKAAFASSAKFVTTTDSSGNVIPAPQDGQGNALSFAINFNAASGLWYVLQYAPSNSAVKPVLVSVKDADGTVVVISTS